MDDLDWDSDGWTTKIEALVSRDDPVYDRIVAGLDNRAVIYVRNEVFGLSMYNRKEVKVLLKDIKDKAPETETETVDEKDSET